MASSSNFMSLYVQELIVQKKHIPSLLLTISSVRQVEVRQGGRVDHKSPLRLQNEVFGKCESLIATWGPNLTHGLYPWSKGPF